MADGDVTDEAVNDDSTLTASDSGEKNDGDADIVIFENDDSLVADFMHKRKIPDILVDDATEMLEEVACSLKKHGTRLGCEQSCRLLTAFIGYIRNRTLKAVDRKEKLKKVNKALNTKKPPSLPNDGDLAITHLRNVMSAKTEADILRELNGLNEDAQLDDLYRTIGYYRAAHAYLQLKMQDEKTAASKQLQKTTNMSSKDVERAMKIYKFATNIGVTVQSQFSCTRKLTLDCDNDFISSNWI
ncbi:hypothetical protein BC832DRAFT_591483 [Gaertneriomyces semiglobifer]|nr:hypothetical protein BC832DRAFT_591483 [Gaertneriomyces semiglobifer]